MFLSQTFVKALLLRTLTAIGHGDKYLVARVRQRAAREHVRLLLHHAPPLILDAVRLRWLLVHGERRRILMLRGGYLLAVVRGHGIHLHELLDILRRLVAMLLLLLLLVEYVLAGEHALLLDRWVGPLHLLGRAAWWFLLRHFTVASGDHLLALKVYQGRGVVLLLRWVATNDRFYPTVLQSRDWIVVVVTFLRDLHSRDCCVREQRWRLLASEVGRILLEIVKQWLLGLSVTSAVDLVQDLVVKVHAPCGLCRYWNLIELVGRHWHV